MTDPTEPRYFGSSEPPPDNEVDDAFSEPGPAEEALRDQPGAGKKVGGGDAETYFPARTREEARASITAIAEYCRNCLYRTACPQEACAVYRAEQTAQGVAAGRPTSPDVATPPDTEGSV